MAEIIDAPKIDEDLYNADNLELACKLLMYLSSNLPLYNSSMCRPLRGALQPLFEHQQRSMFGGKSLKEHKSELEKKKRAESMKTIKRAEDMKLLEKTQLRADRMKRLVQIDSQDGVNIPLISDGVANDGFNTTILSVMIDSETQSCKPSVPFNDDVDFESSSLNKFRSCYVCKRRFSQLHHFYHSLCPFCAEFNWQKRMQMCNLNGRICLVTGGRVKIGFQCCLKLLRCGATVISTSRFPVDAAKRFAAQTDFPVWRNRIVCVGLDLRDLAYLEFFCEQIHRTFLKLDVIINNACQTIRRPRQYYSHMINEEKTVSEEIRKSPRLQRSIDATSFTQSPHAFVEDGGLTHIPTSPHLTHEESRESTLDAMEQLLAYDLHTKNMYAQYASVSTAMTATAASKAIQGSTTAARCESIGGIVTSGDSDTNTQHPLGGSVFSSAALSQVPLTGEDLSVVVGEPGSGSLLPMGARDVNNQQIDLRRQNSWVLRAHEIETPEVAEVFAINSISPFVLISRLKDMLTRGKMTYEDDLNEQKREQHSKQSVRSGVGSVGKEWRRRVRKATRLRTLNDFIMDTLTTHGPDCKADNPSGTSTRRKNTSTNRDKSRQCGDKQIHSGSSSDEDSGDEWTNSRANHRGAVLEAVQASNCSFVVNVSSMEGKFYRPKTEAHPHTNMAKAALNMMTRTSAADYQRSNIYMTAVDTGWINDENPLEKAATIAERHDFSTPLDEVDAAARILDPVLTALKSAEDLVELSSQGGVNDRESGYCAPPFGCFLKDYFISEW